jgi:hypothetical protein
VTLKSAGNLSGFDIAGSTVALTAGGSIADTDADVDVTAGAVTLNAAGGIGSSGNRIGTDVDTIDILQSQNAYLTETDGLTQLGAKSSGDVDVATQAGDIVNATVDAAGAVTLKSAGNLSGFDIAGSTVALTAGGSITDTDNQVDVTAGAVTLDAQGGIGSSGNRIGTDVDTIDVLQSQNAYLTETDGLTQLGAKSSGDVDVATQAGDIVNATVDADGGVTLDAKDNIRSVSVSGLNKANTGTANLTAGLDISEFNVMADTAALTAGGSITDTDAEVDVTGGTVTFEAQTGIGGAGGADIDTAIATLTATNSTSGDIVITEADDLNLFGASNQGANVDIRSSGSMTVTENPALDPDILAKSSIQLWAGIDGNGDMIFSGTPTLDAPKLTLRAGDGTDGNGKDAKVDLSSLPKVNNVTDFTLIQDGSINTNQDLTSLFSNPETVDLTLESKDRTLDIVELGKWNLIHAKGQQGISGTMWSVGEITLDSAAGTISGVTVNAGTTANLTADNIKNATVNAAGAVTLKSAGNLSEFDISGSTAMLTAGGSITDTDAAADVTAGTVTIDAQGGIGSAANRIGTNVDKIDVQQSQNAYLTEAAGLTQLDVTSTGVVDVETLAGDIANATVKTGGSVTLNAAGSIKATSVDAGSSVVLDAAKDITGATIKTTGGPVNVEGGGDVEIETVTALDNVEIMSETGNVKLNGNVNAAHGGVYIEAKYFDKPGDIPTDRGYIYTHDPVNTAARKLNVAITGYSVEGTDGVNLPDTTGQKAAIVLISGQTLTLGNNAALTAKGVYQGQRGDNRPDVFFKDDGEAMDVAIYVVSKTGDIIVGTDAGNTLNISVGRDTGTAKAVSGETDFGGVVFDALNKIEFRNGFDAYLQGSPVAHLELCSRSAGNSLESAFGLLPYARIIENVTWFTRGCVLRGGLDRPFQDHFDHPDDFSNRAVELARSQPPSIDPIPMPIALNPLDAVDIRVSADQFPLVEKMFLDRDYFEDYAVDLQPVKSRVRLMELLTTINDYQGAVTELLTIVREAMPDPSGIFTQEQIIVARSQRIDTGDVYPSAKRWMEALAECHLILTSVKAGEYTEIGFTSDYANKAMADYLKPARDQIRNSAPDQAREVNQLMDTYIKTYLNAKGG